MQLSRRSAIILIAAFSGAPALAASDPVFTRWGNAIRGYDPVAYFTQGGPVKGSSDFEAEWNGATWRFATAENRDLFVADPDAYAPQFGGYCAFAVANGYTASTVPEAWTIHNGRLYLNYSLDVRSMWELDIIGNIAKGEANWPGVLN